VLVPTVLVLKQPDLGTALTYIAVLMVEGFHGGIALEVFDRRGYDVGASRWAGIF
jgi:cell division protein FtsW (lipid II flippase)